MDGILILNKEKNITSNKAIMKVRKILNIDKIGHCGTLDPDATGVLPILLNKATKLSDLFLEKDKEYIASGIFGIKTDTADISGNIIEKKEFNNINEEDFKKVVLSFLGEYDQIPPMYSAIKKDGKKLYELARKNITIEVEPRRVKVLNIELLEYKFNETYNSIEFKIKVLCSKGMYIRTLLEDICVKSGNIGTLTELERTKSGIFSIDNSYKINDIENNEYKIITIDELFKNHEYIIVNDYMANLVKNGITLDERQITTEKIFKVYNKNKKLIAIYKPFEKNKYKPVVIL